MKLLDPILFLAFTLVVTPEIYGQPNPTETFTTSGNSILDPCGNPFVPKGINYALLDDWDFPNNLNVFNGELSSQIILASPNAVRIQWYVNYGQPDRPLYSLTDLDSVISRFERYGIVSIIEMHDGTCGGDSGTFANIVSYWTSDDMVNLIYEHRHSMMLNLANEYGLVNWAANPEIAYQNWLSECQTGIDAIRSSGIHVPIIIDAPDCGTSIDRLLQASEMLYQSDVLGNIILSVHAYFYQYSAAQMANLATQAANSEIPLIFGEVANIQDAAAPCSDSIPNYPALLEACTNLNIGWFAWVWTDDFCPDRRISSDGMIDNLTPYGEDIIYNVEYGLFDYAQQACFNNGSSTGQMSLSFLKNDIVLSPNPTSGYFKITARDLAHLRKLQFTFFDISGKPMPYPVVSTSANNTYCDITEWPKGIYFVRFSDQQTLGVQKIIKY